MQQNQLTSITFGLILFSPDRLFLCNAPTSESRTKTSNNFYLSITKSFIYTKCLIRWLLRNLFLVSAKSVIF